MSSDISPQDWHSSAFVPDDDNPYTYETPFEQHVRLTNEAFYSTFPNARPGPSSISSTGNNIDSTPSLHPDAQHHHVYCSTGDFYSTPVLGQYPFQQDQLFYDYGNSHQGRWEYHPSHFHPFDSSQAPAHLPEHHRLKARANLHRKYSSLASALGHNNIRKNNSAKSANYASPSAESIPISNKRPASPSSPTSLTDRSRSHAARVSHAASADDATVRSGTAPSTATATIKQETEPKKLHLACFFCRARKIACGPPLSDDPDKSCNQCRRRNLTCVYPLESRRGQRTKKPDDSAFSSSTSNTAPSGNGGKLGPTEARKLRQKIALQQHPGLSGVKTEPFI